MFILTISWLVTSIDFLFLWDFFWSPLKWTMTFRIQKSLTRKWIHFIILFVHNCCFDRNTSFLLCPSVIKSISCLPSFSSPDSLSFISITSVDRSISLMFYPFIIKTSLDHYHSPLQHLWYLKPSFNNCAFSQKSCNLWILNSEPVELFSDSFKTVWDFSLYSVFRYQTSTRILSNMHKSFFSIFTLCSKSSQFYYTFVC